MLNEIKIMLDVGAYCPTRAYPTDAGMDLRAMYAEEIRPHDHALIDTGVHVQIPEGYYGKVDSKSGLCVKHNLVTEAGIIDCGYTGSVKVSIRNNGDFPYVFSAGDKIAQLIIIPCETPMPHVVDSFDETDRGDGGFGSTGK